MYSKLQYEKCFWTVQKHFVYIMQIALQAEQWNWICRLGRLIVGGGALKLSQQQGYDKPYTTFILRRQTWKKVLRAGSFGEKNIKI